MASADTDAGIRWVPLESNPEVMTKYSRALGAKQGEFVDIFSLDDDSLAVTPKPVKAVILLYPITPEHDQFCKEQDDAIKEKGQVVAEDLYFMKQFIHNACGTIGMIHALANNADEVELRDDSTLKQFIISTQKLDAAGKGKELEGFNKIANIHEEIAAEGQTAGNRDDQLVTHFVTFVNKDGYLYELDGRREQPINHGPTTNDTFLKDAAAECKKRMERDPNEYRFTVVALTTGKVE